MNIFLLYWIKSSAGYGGIRACSAMMSVKNGGVQPLLRPCQPKIINGGNPPPPCHKKNMIHQRMIVDLMLMTVKNLRSFLTVVTPTAVTPPTIILSHQFKDLSLLQMLIPVPCILVYEWTCKLVIFVIRHLSTCFFCVLWCLFTCVLVNWPTCFLY